MTAAPAAPAGNASLKRAEDGSIIGSLNDILLISDFGRSAQGWLSYMLCYVLNARWIEPYAFLTGRRVTDSPIIHPRIRGDLPGRSPTRFKLIVKTHSFPDRDFNLTQSVVFLTRDPRDVAISYYYMNRNWLREGARSPKVLLQGLPAIGHLLIALRWRRHFARWEGVNAHRVRYEDLRRDTEGTIASILHRFDVPVDSSLIGEAVEIFSFEKAYGRKRGTEDRSNSEARKGQIGDYRNHFSPLFNRIFWMICGRQAERAGYRLDGSTTTEPGSAEDVSAARAS